MRSLEQNGPLRRNIVFAVASITTDCQVTPDKKGKVQGQFNPCTDRVYF